MSQAIQKAAMALVDRARQGDQNAMGMLAMIRRNRQLGNPKAATAFKYALSYIQKKPPSVFKFGACHQCTSFGELREARGNRYGRTLVRFILDLEPSKNNSRTCAHIVARLRPIDRNALRQVLSNTPPNVRRLFGDGYRNPHTSVKKAQGLSEGEVKCLQLGYILGLAQRIQEQQEYIDVPISRYSPSVGWELGE